MDTVTTLKLLGVEQVTDVVYETFAEFKASKKNWQGARSWASRSSMAICPVGFEKGVVDFQAPFQGKQLIRQSRSHHPCGGSSHGLRAI
jgi:hypothetical protein